jgi:hypothetical protein
MKKMEKKKEPKKTKYLLKAHIKLHPTIQEPINKGTEIFIGVMIGIVILLIAYLLIDTLLIKHPESPRPTQEQIDEMCENKNMESYGYTTENNPQGILNNNHTSKTYITCKTPYPAIYEIPEKTIPECCYPDNCPQAEHNPKKCNCIYLTYCIKQGNDYKQWTYKESPEKIEYWNAIMLGIQMWGIIIIHYVPELKEMGISNNDITNNFKEILEAHIGEQLYLYYENYYRLYHSNVQKIKMR